MSSKLFLYGIFGLSGKQLTKYPFSGYDFHKQKNNIPIIAPKGAGKLQGRYSTPTLLLCWMEYIQQSVHIFEPEFEVLKKLLPPPNNFNAGRRSVEGGYAGSDGVFKERVQEHFPDAKSFVPTEWLFSAFVRDVLDGDIDCDTFDVMKTNLTEHYDEVKKTYAKLVKRGSPPSDFTPKKKPKSGNTGSAAKKKSIIPLYVRTLPIAFNFTNEVNVQKTKKVLPPLTKKDLCESFQHYLEKDLVKKVIFDTEKIKKLLEEEEAPPKTGAAGLIYESLVPSENDKETKKKRKKWSGADLTALMSGETKANDEGSDRDDINKKENPKKKKPDLTKRTQANIDAIREWPFFTFRTGRICINAKCHHLP